MKLQVFDKFWTVWWENFYNLFSIFLPSFRLDRGKVHLKGIERIFSSFRECSCQWTKWINTDSLPYLKIIFKCFEAIKKMFLSSELSKGNLVFWDRFEIIRNLIYFYIIIMSIYLIFEEVFIFRRANEKETDSVSYLCYLKSEWILFIFRIKSSM